MKLKHCILLPLAIALALGAGARGVLQNPIAKGNVSIQFPMGWSATAGTGRTVMSGTTAGVDQDATGKFQATCAITQDTGKSIDAAAQQKVLASTLAQYQVVDKPTAVAAGPLKGVMFGGTFKQGNVVLRSRQYMFVVNNQIFTVTFTCLNSQWGNYAPFIEASIATLQVK